MSYILEALKKAQAERQIGSAPTIHAPTLASVPVGQGARSKRTPVIVAMALMIAAIAGLATMLVRQQPAATQPAAGPSPAATAATTAAAPNVTAPRAVVAGMPEPASAPPASTPLVPAQGTAGGGRAQAAAAASPVAPPRLAAASAVVPQPAAVAPRTATAAAPHIAAAPAAAAPVAAESRAAPSIPPSVPPQPGAATQAPAGRAAEAPRLAAAQQTGTATRGADAAPVTAPAEEHVQSMQELPEPIQRAIPQISLGGYMYSKNPADRLLLIDKVLRGEGEEVAPGLVLDKLLPKQAIFRFRGYRYRVPL